MDLCGKGGGEPFGGTLGRLRSVGILLAFQASIAVAAMPPLTGRVSDAAAMKPVAGAIVLIVETSERTVTDDQGLFRFERLAPGRYTVEVHHIAYADVERSITVHPGTGDSILISLQPALLPAAEVVVRSLGSSMSATPYPVQVELHDQLNGTSGVTLPDALKDLPGVSLVRDGTWEAAISIRGLSRSDIIMLVDNTRIETANDIAGALSLVNLHDLERVETVQSSGSVLYGSGALGGVVHLITRRPSFTGEPRVRGEVTADFTSVDGGVSEYAALEGSAERLGWRLSGGYRKAGNTMTPGGLLPNSQYRDFSLCGTLGLKTFEEQSLVLTYQRSQAEDTGIPGGSPIGAAATATYTLARRELIGLEYSVPNITPEIPMLTFRASRQEIDRNVEIIQNPAVRLTPHAVHATLSMQAEARVMLHEEDLLAVGGELWQRELDSRRERYSGVQVVGERPVPSSSFFSGGVYAQNEWHIVPDKLTATCGARYDWIRVRNDQTLNPEYIISGGTLQTSPPNQQVLWQAMSARNSSWSANAGIWQELYPALDVTFLASTAFRSPSLEERYQFIDLGSVVHLGNPSLKPERSICLTAGVRWHRDGLRMQADLFLNHLRDLVTEAPGVYEGRPALIGENIGEARLYGYEISGEIICSSWSALEASLSYVRGEDILHQADLPFIAPLNGHVALRCAFTSWGGLRIVCRGAGTQNHLAPGEVRTPGYAVVDADFSSEPLGGGPLTVRSGIHNLLDKGYQDHLSTLRGAIRMEPGRNFVISATVTL